MSTEQTDWQELCRELVDELHSYASANPHHDSDALMLRARAALAAEPVVEGPTPSDEELLATLDQATANFPPRHPEAKGLNAVGYQLALELRKARAVLARWGRPAPVPAEVAELARWLRENANSAANVDHHEPAALLNRAADLLERQAAPVLEPALARINDILNDSGRVLQTDEREALDLARQALEQRQAAPVPVAVSERLPEPTDEELLATLNKATAEFPPRHPEAEALNAVEYALELELRKARAVLASWGSPAPPAAGEVADEARYLAKELRDQADDLSPSLELFGLIHRAADLLESQAAPVPAEGEVADYADFVAWLVSEMPAGTVISDPLWWAPRIARRAADLLERQPAPPAKAPAPLLAVELAAWLRERATWCAVDDPAHEKYDCAADLLEHQAAPVPVAVSERLPAPEDCDAEGFCWWFSPADPSAGTFGVAACWVLRKYEPEDDFRTHWLPANALPLPSGEVE